MADLQGPTGPEDPYGKIRTHEIHKDPQREEEGSKRSPNKASLNFIKLIRMMKKFLCSFQKKTEQETQRGKNSVVEDLKLLKKILDEHKISNLSSDTDYLNRLSDCWRLFCRDFERHKASLLEIPKLQKLQRSIGNYQDIQQYPLGHYLDESAGRDWIPFPCIELLKSLHEEHLNHSETSHLNRWTREIEKIIEKLAT